MNPGGVAPGKINKANKANALHLYSKEKVLLH